VAAVGVMVGKGIGLIVVGDKVGLNELRDGFAVVGFAMVGFGVLGALVGLEVGDGDGFRVVGKGVGLGVGRTLVGLNVGDEDGFLVFGNAVGLEVGGTLVGLKVGDEDGFLVGARGTFVGLKKVGGREGFVVVGTILF
jgi:hypothetical protein